MASKKVVLKYNVVLFFILLYYIKRLNGGKNAVFDIVFIKNKQKPQIPHLLART